MMVPNKDAANRKRKEQNSCIKDSNVELVEIFPSSMQSEKLSQAEKQNPLSVGRRINVACRQAAFRSWHRQAHKIKIKLFLHMRVVP